MRFMSIVKADKEFKNGAPPDPKLMAAIGKLSEEMMKAGVLLDTGGLMPSARAAPRKRIGRASWRSTKSWRKRRRHRSWS